MSESSKIIGTAVPLFSLASKKTTSLSGTYEEGLMFLEWLKFTNQHVWQLLPLDQTQLEPGSSKVHVSSPYKGYGIGLDPRYLPNKSDSVLTEKNLSQFLEKNKSWLHDYVLFCALRDHFGTDDWTQWRDELKTRNPEALETWKTRLAKEIHGHLATQYFLHEWHERLKIKARHDGIRLIGDMPFYITVNSPLVWIHQDLFDFAEDTTMLRVSGVPDLYHSHFGRQKWGHPLYLFDNEKKVPQILDLFKLRLTYLSTLYDVVRLDHITGLFYYGSLDVQNQTKDRYIKGPGTHAAKILIDHSKKCGLEIIVDDSASRRFKEMQDFFETISIPTSRIFRFAYNEKLDKLIPKNADIRLYEKNTVVYTTTHDSEPLISYLKKLKSAQRKLLARHAHIAFTGNLHKLAASFRGALLRSNAQMIIIPIQDWLLTTDRINTPGTEQEVDDPNWRYRMTTPIEDLPQKIGI